MAKPTSITPVKPEFQDVKRWYEQNLHPDANDYDEQRVYEHVYHDGRWAGIFQLTSKGAQDLFKAAKPVSIVDIAVLTSIYRPGPLAAHVDKLYLEAKQGKRLDWGHPLFEKALGQTYNCLIFQESVMDLAEIVGGFPKDQCDNVRRTIMKRDLSKGDAAKAEASRLEADFVKGAMERGVKEETARKAYQQILYYAGYGFNRAHAIAYAIDSYMCAWLLTHHPDEWVCSYLDSMSGSPENKAEAYGYVKALGYTIVPIDINHAAVGWTALSGKRLMPSLTTVKGVGDTAFDELSSFRPVRSIEELLWNDDGSWRPSKFNRKAMEALVKARAFESIGCVGEGKVFRTYKHMHEVLFGSHPETVTRKRKDPETGERVEVTEQVERDHSQLVKKSTKSDPHEGRKQFYELARTSSVHDEWTRQEQARHQLDLFGAPDVSELVGEEVTKKLADRGIRPIDAWDGKDLYWFVVDECTPKSTKNDRKYLDFVVLGPVGRQVRLKAWSHDGVTVHAPLTVCVAEVDRNDFGHSTSCKKLRVIG